MRNFLSIIIILAALSSYSQNCKYERNEIDEFTNAKILETKMDAFFLSGMGFGFTPSYSLLKINEERILRLSISSSGFFSVSKGDEIMFKLVNDDIIKLKYNESVVSEKINISNSLTAHKVVVNVYLDSNSYSTLLQNDLKKVRLYLTDGYREDDVKPKRAKKFRELLKCIE